MNEELKAAITAVTAAVKDKPAKAFAEVSASDIVLIGTAIDEKKHTDLTRSLTLGASRANPRNNPELKVLQYAGQVRQLLELAGG